MEIKEKGKDKISFNLSPSSLNLYYQSPLLFYLTHIAKVADDTAVPVCYGLSGNIVHECLEKYAKKEFDKDGGCIHLINKWENCCLHKHLDLGGNPLNQIDYLTAMLNGMQIIDSYETHVCEETIQFPFKENETMKIGIKGIIDLQATKKDEDKPVIIDYKTSNNISESKNFERQALFYNLLVYKKKNILPVKTHFHYLKLGVSKDYLFNLAQIEEFYKELNSVAEEILFLGEDINNYPVGEIEDVFNSKKGACLREMERRKRKDNNSCKVF